MSGAYSLGAEGNFRQKSRPNINSKIKECQWVEYNDKNLVRRGLDYETQNRTEDKLLGWKGEIVMRLNGTVKFEPSLVAWR